MRHDPDAKLRVSRETRALIGELAASLSQATLFHGAERDPQHEVTLRQAKTFLDNTQDA